MSRYNTKQDDDEMKELEPILLSIQPTVQLAPLPIPPAEYATVTRRWAHWCIGLQWLVVLAAVVSVTYMVLVQAQWNQQTRDELDTLRDRWKQHDTRLEIEASRHVLSGNRGQELWTRIVIEDQPLPLWALHTQALSEWHNASLAGIYVLERQGPQTRRSFGNATWFFGLANETLLEWYVLDTQQGQAHLFQSLDGSMVCAEVATDPLALPVCVYHEAPRCTQWSTLAYVDPVRLLRATWTITHGSYWCVTQR